MRRITLALLVMFVFFGNNAHAQLEVVFSGNPTVQPGGQVSVDVSVNNFDNLFGVQFSMNWDSLVLEYNSVTNIVANSILPDVSMASVGNPSAAGVDPGQATFSWFPFDGTGKSVPDGTVLFTLVFDGVGAACTSTSIVISNDPRVIEVSVDDGNNTDIGAVSSGIALEINCNTMMDCGPNNGNPNCGSGTAGGLGIIGSDELVSSGTNVCMEITVENFSDIQSAEMNVVWDASLLSYTGSQNYCSNVVGFGASNFNFLGNNMGNDTLRMVWFDFNANMPATLPDDKVLFEVCFDAVGPNGSYADVMFLNTEFGDSNQNQVANYTDCGSVEICVGTPPPTAINLYAQDTTFMGGQEICVPVYVDEFTDVQSFQFTMDWVDGVLAYSSIQNINPAIVPDPLFNSSNGGILPLNWFTSDPAGVTLPNGAILFEVCFDLVGDCTNSATNTSFISFINQPNFDIEFGDINDQLIEPVTTSGANITIDCPDCDVTLTTNNPACIGETGSILVSGGVMPYMSCEWSYNDDDSYDPGGCNVFAGLPGNYSVTVVDANGQICELATSLVNPTPISFTPVVNDISCNGAGTINVPDANISGGTEPYSVAYSTDGPYTTATTITITVTDDNDCSQTQSVSVGSSITPLAVANTSSSGSCTNDAGEVIITLSGGCPPYSGTNGVSSGNAVTFSGLTDGDYTEVISDSQGNMISVGPVNVPTFDTPTGTATTSPASNGGTDGSISLSIMGGVMPYDTMINPAGGTPSADGYSGLAPGEYTITVTDDNGCMLVLSGIMVDELPDLTDTIILNVTILSAAEFSGFGVSCNGSCDGSISTDVMGANGSLASVVINGETVTADDLNADELCPGIYTVVVVDEEGVDGQVTYEITEPEQLVVDMFEVECDTTGLNTGSIDMIVTGGAPDYTYTWSSGQDTEDISGLSAGSYTLMVEDANGCLDIENLVVVEPCMTVGPCYNANNIITPGASAGANDFLEIECTANNPNNLNIYDRWGRVVHTAANYNNNWGGMDMDGNDLGEGTYYWVMDVTFSNGETRLFKGFVTILRDL